MRVGNIKEKRHKQTREMSMKGERIGDGHRHKFWDVTAVDGYSVAATALATSDAKLVEYARCVHEEVVHHCFQFDENGVTEATLRRLLGQNSGEDEIKQVNVGRWPAIFNTHMKCRYFEQLYPMPAPSHLHGTTGRTPSPLDPGRRRANLALFDDLRTMSVADLIKTGRVSAWRLKEVEVIQRKLAALDEESESAEVLADVTSAWPLPLRTPINGQPITPHSPTSKQVHLFIFGYPGQGKTALVKWMEYCRNWRVWKMSSTLESSIDYGGQPLVWIDEFKGGGCWTAQVLSRLCDTGAGPINVKHGSLTLPDLHFVIITSNYPLSEMFDDNDLGIVRQRFVECTVGQARKLFGVSLPDTVAAYDVERQVLEARRRSRLRLMGRTQVDEENGMSQSAAPPRGCLSTFARTMAETEPGDPIDLLSTVTSPIPHIDDGVMMPDGDERPGFVDDRKSSPTHSVTMMMMPNRTPPQTHPSILPLSSRSHHIRKDHPRPKPRELGWSLQYDIGLLPPAHRGTMHSFSKAHWPTRPYVEKVTLARQSKDGSWTEVMLMWPVTVDTQYPFIVSWTVTGDPVDMTHSPTNPPFPSEVAAWLLGGEDE